VRKLLFPLIMAALFLPASAHAYCYGYTDPIAPITPSGNVCGTVYRQGFNGSYYVTRTAGTSYVKICPAGSSPNSFSCSTTTTGSYTDGYGSPVQAYNFVHYRQGATTYQDYDFYAWGYNSTDYWGSSTKPIRRVSVSPNGTEGISIYMPPRPLNPTPQYPSGTTVPSSYTVTWFSGIDTDRSPYAVNYEVWFKYWPFDGTEPATWSLSRANMPCHDDGSGPTVNGQCSTYVAGPQPAGNWKWYVVANLNVSNIVWSGFGTTYFTTQSGWVAFTQPQ
jgi:hypothetical protein